MRDLISADAVPLDDDRQTPDGAAFVRVYADKAHDRAVIALDGDAVDDLLQLINDIGPGYDLAVNAGYYGLDQATADRIADIAARITGPLGKLKGYI